MDERVVRGGGAGTIAGRRHWPCVIVGGGPGATLQAGHIVRTGELEPARILVIGGQWGAPGVAFLGAVRLQSYLNELELGLAARPLSAYTAVGFIQPTGAEYDRYVRDVLRACGVTRCQGWVEDLRRDGAGFVLTVCTGGREAQVATPRVVLATGSRQRRAPAGWRDMVISCDEVFADIAAGRTGGYAGRPALVVGSGNSAMQVAALLAPVCQQVTVLASKYLGMYPHETDDRFALRAASQLTWELVVKSSRSPRCGDGVVPCVRFLVYRTLTMSREKTVFTYRAADNGHQMGRHSLPGHHAHARATRLDGDELQWREERRGGERVVVWATGREPVYPRSELIGCLPADERGTLLTDGDGQTAARGLFLTGACAGQRSVNETVPARAFGAGDPPGTPAGPWPGHAVARLPGGPGAGGDVHNGVTSTKEWLQT
jgi:pyridine nucleotide-disulfide oxidoreductase